MAHRDHRLRARRERLDLTQTELGELAGLPINNSLQVVVSNAERGRPTPARVIDQLRRALLWEETKKRRAREQLRREAQRIAGQESLWDAVPDSPEKAALLAAMLDRCLDLMHNGSGEECDAIADWLPRADVERMFERWWVEQGADRRCACCVPEGLVLA